MNMCTMKNKKIYNMQVLLVPLLLLVSGCQQHDPAGTKDAGKGQNKVASTAVKKENYKVTFIELGSVKCIPCQRMQPVMKSIEEKFKGQVKVLFYDVWTEKGKPYAAKYRIRAIPTQVFLERNGKEFFRHEGFFPEEEIIKILQMKGVK